MRSVVQLYPGPPSSGVEFQVSSFEARGGIARLLETGNTKLEAAIGAVAQLGERLVCNQEATGSIPVSSTNLVPRRGSRVASKCQFNVGCQQVLTSNIGLEAL